MNSNSFMLSRLGLALVALLSTGISSASAQTVHLETCAEPFPNVEPYQVLVAPDMSQDLPLSCHPSCVKAPSW
jgi:hypothetical protein